MEKYVHSEHVTKKLQTFYENEVMCDVTLKSEDCKINAHRTILATCSEYFYAMFNGNWTESSGREVSLNGLTSVGLKAVVEFAYYGKITLDVRNISSMVSALDQCMVTEAINLCEDFLIEKLDHSTYEQFFKLAYTFQLKNVQEHLVKFVVREFLPKEMTSEDQSEIHTDIFRLEPSLFSLVLKEWEYSKIGWGQLAVVSLVLQWAKSDMDTREKHIAPLLSIILKKEIDASVVNDFLSYYDMEKDSVELEDCIVTGITEGPVYNVEGKNWFKLPKFNTGMFFGMAVLDNSLYICGGHDRGASVLCCKYLPNVNRWFSFKPMSKARWYHTLVASSHKLFAFGGIFKDEPGDSVEIYNPSEDVWYEGAPLPEPLACHATAVHDGKIYISGGFKELEGAALDDLICYDPEEDQYTYKKNMIEGRLSHEMIAHKDRLYVFSGRDCTEAHHDHPVDDPMVEYYDVLTDDWTRLDIIQYPYTASLYGACSVGDDIYILFENFRVVSEGGYGGWDPKLYVATFQPEVGSLITLYEGDSKLWVSDEVSTTCLLKIPSFMTKYMQ